MKEWSEFSGAARLSKRPGAANKSCASECIQISNCEVQLSWSESGGKPSALQTLARNSNEPLARGAFGVRTACLRFAPMTVSAPVSFNLPAAFFRQFTA